MTSSTRRRKTRYGKFVRSTMQGLLVATFVMTVGCMTNSLWKPYGEVFEPEGPVEVTQTDPYPKQKLHHKTSLDIAWRVLLTPLTVAFDIVTFPIQGPLMYADDDDDDC